MKIVIVGKAGTDVTKLCESMSKRGRRGRLHTTEAKRRESDSLAYIFEEPSGDVLAREEFEVSYLPEQPTTPVVNVLTKAEWDAADFVVLSPAMLGQLPEEERNRSFVMLMEVPECVRASNLPQHVPEECERRLKRDADQFTGFSNFDVQFNDFGVRTDTDILAEDAFDRGMLLAKETDLDKVKAILKDDWNVEVPLTVTTVEQAVVSAIHAKLGSMMTIQEGGAYLFVYMDSVTRRLRTVGNCRIDLAANSLFEGLSRTIFKKVRQSQLDAAEAFVLIQMVFDSPAFGSFSKKVQTNIRGYLAKGVPEILARGMTPAQPDNSQEPQRG